MAQISSIHRLQVSMLQQQQRSLTRWTRRQQRPFKITPLSHGNNSLSKLNRRLLSSETPPPSAKRSALSHEERQEKIRYANEQMKGYAETRILAKQGKLKSKRPNRSKQSRSEYAIQFSLFISLAAAFIASPILGKKMARDEEFREKYLPSWMDFRVKQPDSAWTREELHEQIVQVEQDLRQRAVNGEFTPENLAALKRNLQPRQDLSEEDLMYAKKYGWGNIHPGYDPDDEDDFDDDEEE